MIRYLKCLFLRWRRDATDRELYERALDGSLCGDMSVHYMRLRNYYDRRLAQLEAGR